MIFSFVSIRIATTLITPYELGRQSIFLNIGTILCLLFSSPIVAYWNRHLHQWKENGKLVHFSLLFLLYLAGLLLPITLLMTLVNKFVGVGTPLSNYWLLWIIISGFFLSQVNGTFTSSLNFLDHRITYVAITNIVLWGGLLLSVVFVRNFGPNGEWWYSGSMVMRLLVVALILPIALFRIGKDTGKEKIEFKKEISGMIDFSSPLFIYSIIYIFQNNSYPFLFSIRANTVALGLFVVGSGIGATPVAMFNTLFQEYYNPIFYKSITNNPDQKSKAWNSYVEIYLPTIVAFCIFTIGVSPIMVKLAVGPAFQSVGWLAIWGCVAQFLVVIYSMFNLASHAYLKTNLMILPTVLGAIVTVILLILLLPVSPLLGGALAVTLGNLAICLGMLWQIKGIIHTVFPWKRISNAIFLSLPILLTMFIPAWLSDKVLILVAIFFMAGFYALGVQVFLGRNWLLAERRINL